MKIAAVTEKGINLSAHFGMAPAYRILTVDNGKIVGDEIVEKPHHKKHPEHGEGGSHHGHGGMQFFDPIKDCQVLLVGGMGEPAYQRAVSFGLEVIMTSGNIDEVVRLYLKGELVSDQRRVHSH